MIMETLILKFENKILEYRKIIDKELLNVYNDGPTNIKEPIYHILKGGKRFDGPLKDEPNKSIIYFVELMIEKIKYIFLQI